MKLNKTSNTEKITININIVDLGYIDLLVNEGHYSSRTEFIKTAIKRQLEYEDDSVKMSVRKKIERGSRVEIGVGGFTREELETLNKENKKIKVIFVGYFSLPDDIDLELLEKTVESIKVFGICKCKKEIKEKYNL